MKTSWVCAGMFLASLSYGHPSNARDSGKREATIVGASEIEIVEHTAIQPARSGNDDEDAFRHMHVFGEMKNHSARTVRILSADVTFFDAGGKAVQVDSIGAAVKRDLHDNSPGDTVYSEVHQIPPGGTAPFHYIRNLKAIRGDAASHRLTPRPARTVADPAVGVAVGVRDTVAEMTNPALPNSTVHGRMRAFEGALRNVGKTGCRDPKYVVALLAPDGKIREVHAFDARVNDNQSLVVAPREEVRFKGAVWVEAENAWRESAGVKSWVDCDEPW